MKQVQHVGILGAGTAGYLTALSLRKVFPGMNITMIESPRIPIIGVGEATTSLIVGLLHDILELDVREFYEEVQPTWKLGLRFWWGEPGPQFFDYPFGSLALQEYQDFPEEQTYLSLAAMLMDQEKSFLVPDEDRPGMYRPLKEAASYAYHLDVQRFVDYLQKKAVETGIERRIAEIQKVVCSPEGEVQYLLGTDGKQHTFDLYIDCSGFRSVIMGKALGSAYTSYDNFFLTDRAIVGPIQDASQAPYTTAITMKHGWSWRLPLHQEDHVGYVYSANHCSDEEALEELQSYYQGFDNYRIVPFRSGRRAHFWQHNVVALGNAYGFLEPLDATGIHLTINMVKRLIAELVNPDRDPDFQEKANRDIGQQWEYIRWLLSIQFKFNEKMDTPFWRDCRSQIDISDFQELIDVYRECGMISRLPRTFQYLLIPPDVYRDLVGYEVIDTKLLGLGIRSGNSSRVADAQQLKEWQERIRQWEKTVARALPYKEAIQVLADNPDAINWDLLKFSAIEPFDQSVFFAPAAV